MRELLGFFTLLALSFAGLYVAGFIFSFLMPVLTHPIATIIFIGFFVLFAVRLVKASER
jgi:hypothetical protein